MLSEGDWVVLKLAVQNLRSPVGDVKLVYREDVLELLRYWVEAREVTIIEIYQKALKRIATDPCLFPEGNAKLARAALKAAE